MMKKIFIFAAMLLLAVSCLDKGGSTYENYPMISDFEYNTTTQALFADSLAMYKTPFSSGAIDSYNTVSGHDFTGGLALAYKNDTTLYVPRTEPISPYTSYNKESTCNPKAAPGTNYVIFYQNPDESKMPEHDMIFNLSKNGTAEMKACCVCNTTQVVSFIKGLENAPAFADGDYFKLKLTGRKGDSITGEETITMAEKTASKDSLIMGWTAVDLSKVGEFEKIDLEILTNRKDIPPYVCLDYLYYIVNLTF